MDSTSSEQGREDPGAEEATRDLLKIQEKPKRVRMIPHNYVCFLKDADKEIDSSSESILDQLYKGILLGGGKKKYWIDKDTNNNCLMMFSRALDIVHGANQTYWEWGHLEISDGAEVEVAVLLNVCWLEIKGKFRTIMFSPGTLYEVVIVVKMMRENSHGWNIPVMVEFTLPDGQTNKSARLLQKTRDWADVLLGEFTVTPTTVGELTFSLTETNNHWKSGLIIKGVVIRPKLITLS